MAGDKPKEYDTGVDSQAAYAGRASAYLKATKSVVEGFGTLMQDFGADQYLGKRVRFSAFVKAEEVQEWAGLWMRVDKKSQMLTFDNMQDRPIKGTIGWQSYEVILDVPSNATGIYFGILLRGTGTVWLNNVNFEIVGTNISVTGRSRPGGPTNLALEGLATKAPRGWYMAGDKPKEYDTGVDSQAAYAGRASAYLKANKPVVEGFGTLMQDFGADQYLGKRVRFSAFVKAEDVQEGAGLWMQVDKGQEKLAFDNMQDRSIKGTTGWQSYEVVLDVPSNATDISLGILLRGTGTVWLNNVNFEVVGSDVATTRRMPTGPTNLGFEK